MPIGNLIQPDTIIIDDKLRLCSISNTRWEEAEPWYQNPQIMYYSEGKSDETYDMEDIDRMYSYLSRIGELYFIEAYEDGEWIAIGDVTLADSNMPIILGKESYWGQGIGKKVLRKLIDRAVAIGMLSIDVPEIYHYNSRSRNLFKSLGFEKVSENDMSEGYRIEFS